MKRSRKVVSVPISAIKVLNSRDRNRARFKELVRSIGALGLKRPITVSKRGGAYDLACGEGRLEAFAALKQIDIPTISTEASVEDCSLRREQLHEWRGSIRRRRVRADLTCAVPK